MTFPNLRIHTADRVGWIILDRPPLNVISTDMANGIAAAVRTFDADPSVAVVAISSVGDRAFAAGSDVGEHQLHAAEEHTDAIFAMVGALLEPAGKPRIAVAKGICSGGGAELAFSCDLVIARDDARIALPEIKIGVVSVVAGYVMAPRMGVAKMLDLAMSGDWIDANAAERMGLLAAVLPSDGFEAAVDAFLKRFTSKSAAALRVGRELVLEALGDRTAALERLKSRVLSDAIVLDDYAEGVAAFLEKRTPTWADR